MSPSRVTPVINMVEINSTSLNAVNPPSLSPLSVVSMFT